MIESVADASSDYGDFSADEQVIIDELVADVSNRDPPVRERLQLAEIEDYEEPRGLRLPETVGKQSLPPWSRQQRRSQPRPRPAPAPATATGGDAKTIRDRRAPNVDSTAQKQRAERERAEEDTRSEGQASGSAEAAPDGRSPMERFRTKPKKALSVTDLVSPAWCELQYFFSLSKHGRKRPTAAMRQGTRVHKAREEAVHVTVAVQTTSREDGWGLRVWNVIQGVRTLRETGRTRELELWGCIDGELVNGVVDELSHEPPVPGLRTTDDPTPTSAKTIDQAGTGIEEGTRGGRADDGAAEQATIYLTEIKTRGSRSLPSAMAFRPAEMQLQLYYGMIESLTRGHVPLRLLLDRHDLDGHSTFSDSFVAQVCGLSESQHDDTADDDPASRSSSLLLTHNSLSTLWDLMLQTLQQTFLSPRTSTGSRSSSSSSSKPSTSTFLLSQTLTALYLHPTTSSIVGTRSTTYDPGSLRTYVSDEMRWWRGHRPPRGVTGGEAEVAVKCAGCEFRPGCWWLREMEREREREMEVGKKK